jgi:hypothetical protein
MCTSQLSAAALHGVPARVLPPALRGPAAPFRSPRRLEQASAALLGIMMQVAVHRETLSDVKMLTIYRHTISRLT